MRSPVHAWLAWPLLVALAWPRPLQAAGPGGRAAEVPLGGPVEPDPEDMSERTRGYGSRDMSEAPDTPGPRDTPEAPAVEGPAAPPTGAVPAAPRVPAPSAPIVDDAPQQITVAIGLGPSAPGTKPERALVDALERAARSASGPTARVRRLRAGAGEGRAVCREHRDDLVILLEYLPDREDPVLLTRDCRLDRDLGIRGQAAAEEPGLVAAQGRADHAAQRAHEQHGGELRVGDPALVAAMTGMILGTLERARREPAALARATDG